MALPQWGWQVFAVDDNKAWRDPPGARTVMNEPAAPTQTFGTEGIKPMARPGRITRALMQLVAWVERQNLRFAVHGNARVYDTADFPWALQIEREWLTIRAELARVMMHKDALPGFHEISSDVETISTDRDWKTFLLAGYGFKSRRNIELCPETWRIAQTIPGLVTAMFSIFEPGKHLPPHRGPYNGVLRLHLGLIVPEPVENVGIRIGEEVRHWREGKVLIFDDAFEHEAWNDSDQTRVVLFVDFRKPLRFPGNLLNWLLLHVALFTPFIREGMHNHRAWEKKFYDEAQALRRLAMR